MDGTIIVFTTGGTIAMRHAPQRGGAVPAVSGQDLVAAVPGLERCGLLEVREFANIPSPHMTPAMMFDLARRIELALEDPGVAGAVVTHGTDTLEETAWFLDLYLGRGKPVCVTGAMRDAGECGADGPVNLRDAVRCAASAEARGAGVLVVMNQEIHAAREVTKTHSSSVATFASPGWGPLGYADQDRIVFRRVAPAHQRIHPPAIVEDVHIVALGAGSDARLLDHLVNTGAAGIVVQGFGRGNVPPEAAEGMRRAVDAGIPVVLTTRCQSGRVLDVYAYEGGGKQLVDAGVIPGGDHGAAKARILLILALGLTRNPADLAGYLA